ASEGAAWAVRYRRKSGLMTKKSQKSITRKTQTSNTHLTAPLLADLRLLIEQARKQVAQSVNAALVLLNWHIGKRINDEILKNKRAEYGKAIVATVSHQLTVEYGKGYGRRNLFNMLRFAEVFPQLEIVQTVSAQLGWSHFVEIIQLK